MKDLSERILWRARRKGVKESLVFDPGRPGHELPRYPAFEPLLLFSRGQSSYTAIGSTGIAVKADDWTGFIPYGDIDDLELDNSAARDVQYRAFLAGPDRWIQLPQGADFHSFASVILMCIRLSRGAP